ncbi:MAG: hydroxyethylthiazole kinase [Natronomonas sp.]
MTTGAVVDPEELDVDETLAAVTEAAPLVNSITNSVTVNDVANIVLYWGGLPVMSNDDREVADMIDIADACHLNMGDVSAGGEETMLTAGAAANDGGKPVVFDPVGVGATPTRTAVAERIVEDLDVTIIKGNHGEISALAGTESEVRGVESVGEYAEIAETALAVAQGTDSVVVASGVTDIVASPDAAYEVSVGDPMMGQVVGTGCMLGVTLAAVAGAIGTEAALEAALAGTVAFGIAGERAADDGVYNGPASYRIAFLDAVADAASGFDGGVDAESRVDTIAE